MNTKHIILMACAALLGATQANAQGQRSLDINSEYRCPETAAMGNASAAAEGMYLYNNPAAFFATDKKFTADAAASLFEKAEGAAMEPSAFTRFLLAISWLSVMQSSLVFVMLED